jgi:hypothetical protein
MEQRRDTGRGEEVRALASHGIHVTEEGVQRARAKLLATDERMTEAEWQRLREFIDASACDLLQQGLLPVSRLDTRRIRQA